MPFTLLVFSLITLLKINQSTFGLLAPIPEFCSISPCPTLPNIDIEKLNSKLSDIFGPGPAKCGDEICDIFRGETCLTCPQDCGDTCKLTAPSTKCKSPKHFALTFDDGPSPFTKQVLDILKKENVTATFFLNGIHIVSQQPEVQLIFDAGHTIGSHTYSHRSLGNGHGNSRPFTSLPYEHMESELLVNDATIYQIIKKWPRIIRPPFLEYSTASMAFMETVGYDVVNINIDSNDWRVTSPDQVLSNLKQTFTSQSSLPNWILLQHDTLSHSVQALPQIIQFLRSQNVEFVSIDKCLGVSPYRDDGDSPYLAKRIQNNVFNNNVDNNINDNTMTQEISSNNDSSTDPSTSDSNSTNAGHKTASHSFSPFICILLPNQFVLYLLLALMYLVYN